MGGFRYLVPALRFLERPAQLGYAAAGLPLGTELPPLICQNPQMRGCFRTKRIKAACEFSAIFRRIGNQPRRRLLRKGGR